MPKYEDIGKAEKLNIDLADEMKPNGVDLLLPFEDFNSGWVLLSKGAAVTITHNFGSLPRLAQIYINNTASDNNCFMASAGYNSTAYAKIDLSTLNTVRVTNLSGTTANKYIKILLWR
jgi:hypothetical protein